MTSTRPVLPVNFCTVGSFIQSVRCTIILGIGRVTYLEHHEDVMFLYMQLASATDPSNTILYLLVTDGEFALCLFVRTGERLELLDGFCLHHLDAKLDVSFRVFMSWLQDMSVS